MTEPSAPDLRSARLAPAQYAAAFADAVPPLTRAQALVEAERCLYCFDAPCTRACPTAIDVPSFIRRIADDNLRGAARTILDANPLGGTCARACPTEVLCEQVCVRNTEQGKPVEIGRLQRYALDAAMQRPVSTLFTRAATTGRRIAVVGAGPAGLACAFALARRGHEVVIHDARAAPGGLNEYGLAAYKMAGGFAQAEIDWLLGIGGITLRCGWTLSSAAELEALRAQHDAVFLGIGLGATHDLAIPGEQLEGVIDAVEFIGRLRQSEDLGALPVGRRVLVIGGGMTAVDAAVQSKLLGAETVTIVYRRGPEQMRASQREQSLAQTTGVGIRHWLAPLEVLGEGGAVRAMRFARQRLAGARLVPDGEELVLEADMVLKAIGQRLEERVLREGGLTLRDGRIVVDAAGRTGVANLWAGGDCIAEGQDLTVEAVAHGLRAAHDIDRQLRGVRDARQR